MYNLIIIHTCVKYHYPGKALNALSDKILEEIKGRMHNAAQIPRPDPVDDAPPVVAEEVRFTSPLSYEKGNRFRVIFIYSLRKFLSFL